MNPPARSGLIVLLTEPAARRLRLLQEQQSAHAGKPVRIFAQGEACCGLQYGLTFDDRRDDDHATECHGVPVIVDPVSARYLEGAVVDYQEDSYGGGFRINNPKAQRSCGCGPGTDTSC